MIEERKDKSELERRALELCLAIYRLTGLFPDREVLVRQLREVSNEVVGQLANNDIYGSICKIRVLLAYFKIAQAQNWVNKINFEILTREYKRLNEELDKEIKKFNSLKAIKPINKTKELNSRQKKILEFLKEKKQVKISDLTVKFTDISSRTLRRDLLVLLEKKMIQRKGSKKGVIYRTL